MALRAFGSDTNMERIVFIIPPTPNHAPIILECSDCRARDAEIARLILARDTALEALERQREATARALKGETT